MLISSSPVFLFLPSFAKRSVGGKEGAWGGRNLTDARSVLQEVDFIVENLPSVAVRLIQKKSTRKYGMRDSDMLRLSVVEDTYEYEDTDKVIASIRENIIAPAEAKVEELRRLIRLATR